MKEIVCIPTYKRDELLVLCLEAVRSQDKEIPIIVSSDRQWVSDDLHYLCRMMKAALRVVMTPKGFGNSFNVIEALEQGIMSGSGIVHIVEDDTILHPGYLDWARGILATKRYAAVCGHVGNTQDTWYTSPCASWLPDKLQECLQLLPLGYLATKTREEMQLILDSKFTKSNFRFGSAEQDGFFLRCIEFLKFKTAFPEKPLCTHLGAWGYNRGSHEGPKGNFEQRVEWCRNLLANKQRRVELFGQRIVELEEGGL